MTNRFTYTHDSLIGADGKYNAFNCIHAASKMLKGRGLTNQSINKAMDALKGLNQCTGMKGMESLVFVPVFDRDLTENSTGITELADYFNCPVLDVMMYYSYLADLEKNGYLTSENGIFCSLLKRKYRVNTKVLEAIIQGKELNKKSEPEKRWFKDQFDFCRAVSALATSRKNENLDTQELLGAIIRMEEVFASFDIIKTLRDKEISVENRVLFYIICDDYTFGIDKMTDLSELLKDVFDSPGDRLTYRSSIIGLENPLIKEEWIEGVGENSVKLTNQGIKLFLRDKAKAFIKPIEGLDCYGFASAVKKIYREADSDRPGFSDEIKKKLFRLELSNQHLDFVNKLEMDYDALD